MKKKDPEKKVGVMPLYTNSAGIRRALGITRNRFLDFVSVGLPAVGDNVYHVATVVKWYKAETTIGTKFKSNIELSAGERLAVAKVEKLERENALIAGELVDLADARAAFNEIATVFAETFESLAARLASQVSGLDDPAEILALMHQECRQARELVANRIDEI